MNKIEFIKKHAIKDGMEEVREWAPGKWGQPIVKFNVNDHIYYLKWTDAIVVTNNFRYENYSNTDIKERH